jgi:hypothetical protein
LQVWGFWWAVATYIRYMQCVAARRPFRTRGWQPLPFGPAGLRRAPLEPLVKLTLPFVGILGELWLGHESYRSAVGHRLVVLAACWAASVTLLIVASQTARSRRGLAESLW